MAVHYELNQFIGKFVNLWQAGCEASLHVESKAGKAFVNLQLGLGQAQSHPWKSEHTGEHARGRRGGSPAKQRRRARRETEREARVTAEEVVATAETIGGLERNAKKADSDLTEIVTEEVIDGVSDASEVVSETVEYELKLEAHVTCKSYDLIEAIEVNFDGSIDELKIEKIDKCRYFRVNKLEDEPKDENVEKKTWKCRVSVKNCEVAKDILESWKNRYKFDDLAFRNAVYGTGTENIGRVNVRILEVKNLFQG